MEFDLLGWPPDGPALRLDHEQFGYAGKFVMTNTGKAVARAEGVGSGAPVDDPEGVLAAAAFNADRTDENILWIRYLTVRRDRRGEGIGPRLAAFVQDSAIDRGFEIVHIAVNNPFAYEALYRAGFGFTGETTGLAELVLACPGPGNREIYQAGLDIFRDRDLSDREHTFLSTKAGNSPPDSIDGP